MEPPSASSNQPVLNALMLVLADGGRCLRALHGWRDGFRASIASQEHKSDRQAGQFGELCDRRGEVDGFP